MDYIRDKNRIIEAESGKTVEVCEPIKYPWNVNAVGINAAKRRSREIQKDADNRVRKAQ